MQEFPRSMKLLLNKVLLKVERTPVLHHVKLFSQELGFLKFNKTMSTNASKPNLMFSKYDRDRLKCIGKSFTTFKPSFFIKKICFWIFTDIGANLSGMNIFTAHDWSFNLCELNAYVKDEMYKGLYNHHHTPTHAGKIKILKFKILNFSY